MNQLVKFLNTIDLKHLMVLAAKYEVQDRELVSALLRSHRDTIDNVIAYIESPIEYKEVNDDDVKQLRTDAKSLDVFKESIRNDDLARAIQMIRYGAKWQSVNNRGQTMLMVAAESGSENIVKWFVNHDLLDINKVDELGQTALYYAAKNENYSIMRYLFDAGANIYDNADTIAFCAAGCGDLDIVKYCIENDLVEVDDTFENYCEATLLHQAAHCGRLNIVTYLIENRADINVLDDNDLDPLHDAVRNGHWDVAQYLIKQGAIKTRTYDDNERTLLHIAAIYGHDNVYNGLLTAGFPSHLLDSYGLTANIYLEGFKQSH
jgi:ankyrin repeat protein